MLVFGQDLTIPELILSVIAAVIMSTVLKMLDNLALYGDGRPVRVMTNLGTDFPRFADASEDIQDMILARASRDALDNVRLASKTLRDRVDAPGFVRLRRSILPILYRPPKPRHRVISTSRPAPAGSRHPIRVDLPARDFPCTHISAMSNTPRRVAAVYFHDMPSTRCWEMLAHLLAARDPDRPARDAIAAAALEVTSRVEIKILYE